MYSTVNSQLKSIKLTHLFWVNFCIWHQERNHLHFFACGYPTFSAQFVEKTLLSPLNSFGILVENFWSYMQGLISELSNPFHWSVYPHLCQDHIVLINTVSFEIRNCESFNLVLLLKNVLTILGPWDSLWIVVIVVQSLSHVWLFATPWTTTHQASLSFTVSQSLCKLILINQ